MKVFIDTNAFVALFVDKEESHQEIAKKYYDLRDQRTILFTSYYVLDELFTRLLFYGDKIDIKRHIHKLQNAISAGEITVLAINEALFEKSLGIFLKFLEHKISFTDATTYTLYKEFALDEVFTLDSDFKKIGVKTSFD